MRPLSKAVIGVDLGQTTIKGALVMKSGELTSLRQSASNLHVEPENLLDTISQFIQLLIDDARQNSLSIEGIGISSTIDVDATTGCFRVISRDYLSNFQDFPIAQTLKDHFGLPVLIQNDGIAAAWGEYRLGAGRPFQNVISLTLGTGLGGGVILEGKLIPDTLGSASYFGHMCIDMHGDWCSCGHRGCWELYVSGTALENRMRKIIGENRFPTRLDVDSTAKDIVIKAREQDALALRLLEETGQLLGLGLVNLANIFNPEVIVIGGGVAAAGNLILNSAQQVFSKQRMPIRKHIPIRLTSLGQFSGVVGASLLCFEQLEITTIE